MSRHAAFVILLGLMFVACDDPVTDLTPATALPSYTFTNGPSVLPNVLRAGGRIISAFADVERDVLLLAGAPADPTQDRLCGGTELRQFVPVQWVALCQTTPIAAGTGRFLRSDNDFFGVFGHANAVVEHVHGQVTLQSGELANVSARFHALGNPEGVLMRFETTVRLLPMAKPQ